MEIIECKVKTNAKQNKLTRKGNLLIVEISAKPVKGQANKELLKFLKKALDTDVEILKGEKSHNKIIKLGE